VLERFERHVCPPEVFGMVRLQGQVRNPQAFVLSAPPRL
jgi:hypothetical protein